MKLKVLIRIVVCCLVVIVAATVTFIVIQRSQRDQMLYGKAQLAWERNRPTLAIKLLRESLRANPENPEAHKLLLEAYIRRKYFNSMPNALKNARAAGVAERDLKLFEVAMLQRRAAHTLAIKGNHYTDKTCDEIIQGDMQHATDILSSLIQQNPKDAEALNKLGTVHRSVSSLLHSKRRYLSREQANYAKLREQVKADQTLNQIEEMLSEIGKANRRAITAYLACIRANPKLPEPRLALAEIYLQRFHPKLKEARSVLAPLVDKEANNTQALFAMALIESSEENDERAIELLERVSGNSATIQKAQVRIAESLIRLNRMPEADKITDELMLYPNHDPEVSFARARVLIWKENSKGALALLQDILKPEEVRWPQARFELAKALQSIDSPMLRINALRKTIRDCDAIMPTTTALRAEVRNIKYEACLMLAKETKGTNNIEAMRNASTALRLAPISVDAFALIVEIFQTSRQRMDIDWAVLLHGQGFIVRRKYDKAVEVLRAGRGNMQDPGRADAMIATALVRKGDFVGAASVFEELLESGIGDPNKIKLNLADLHTKLGRLDRAEAIYRELLKSFPDSAKLLDSLANVLILAGKIGEADRLLTKADAGGARALKLGIPMISLHLRKGNTRGALKVIENQIQAWPTESRFWVLSALLRWNIGDRAGARKAFDKALSLKGHHPNAYRRVLLDIAEKRFDDALALSNQRLENAPADRPLVLVQGIAFLGKKNYAKANECFAKITAFRSVNQSMRLLGHTYSTVALAAQGRYAAPPAPPTPPVLPKARLAREYELFLGKVNDLSPEKRHDAVMAYTTLRFMELLRIAPEACRQAKILLNVMPGEAIPLFVQARILDRADRHEEALKVYDLLLAARPRFPFARLRKARSHKSNGETRDAIAVMENMLRNKGYRDEPSGVTLAELAAAYGRLGDRARSIKAFRMATKYPEVAAVACNDLAWTLTKAGNTEVSATQLEEALAYAEKAVAMKGDHPLFLDTLGWIYMKMGEPIAAIPHLERATKLGPGHAIIRYHLGKAYIEVGRDNEGVRELRQALARSKRFDGVEDARLLILKHTSEP
jgi:tetratricopeptide (TPR) repeat protein